MTDTPGDIYSVTAQPRPNGRHVLILTDDNVHDLELFYPYYRLSEEGYVVDVVTPKGGEVKGKYGMKLPNTLTVREVEPTSYELLYIPGGQAPEALRQHVEVLKLVRGFVEQGKPVAAFCHGPQVLVSAGLVEGRKLAAWPEVAAEIIEVGGSFVDEPVVKDGPFITARFPGDLPAHLNAVIARLKQDDTKYKPTEGEIARSKEIQFG